MYTQGNSNGHMSLTGDMAFLHLYTVSTRDI